MYTCAECGRRFGGLSGFDKHQVWTKIGFGPAPDDRFLECWDPAELGMHLDARGIWREARSNGYAFRRLSVSPESDF